MKVKAVLAAVAPLLLASCLRQVQDPYVARPLRLLSPRRARLPERLSGRSEMQLTRETATSALQPCAEEWRRTRTISRRVWNSRGAYTVGISGISRADYHHRFEARVGSGVCVARGHRPVMARVHRLEHGGARRVMSIAEVRGVDGDHVMLDEIFSFEREGVAETGRAVGRFRATGHVPQVSARLRSYGIKLSN
jgi:hypothetical protein